MGATRPAERRRYALVPGVSITADNASTLTASGDPLLDQCEGCSTGPLSKQADEVLPMIAEAERLSEVSANRRLTPAGLPVARTAAFGYPLPLLLRFP